MTLRSRFGTFRALAEKWRRYLDAYMKAPAFMATQRSRAGYNYPRRLPIDVDAGT